jgi:chemotaxis protein MotB
MKHQIILRRNKKQPHSAHHGGSWKIAYADFVTAMMALFLVLWLINSATKEQLRGISNYFAPASVSKSQSGSGGLFENPSLVEPITTQAPAPVAPSGARAALRKTLQTIQQEVNQSPELEELRDNIMIDITEEGMEIQLIDQEKMPMFEKGSAKLLPNAYKILDFLSKKLKNMPQKLSITGHTDSLAYSSFGTYSNWELSTDRANAARRSLIEYGLPLERLLFIGGKADKELLFPQDPTSALNRRVSILVHNDT